MSESNIPAALPIAVLIDARSRELGLTPVDVVRRLGFAKIPKGLDRLEALRTGQYRREDVWLRKLPEALQVDTAVVDRALSETSAALWAAADADWRATFKPHAVILTQWRIPQQLVIAALIGAGGLIRIPFDLEKGPDTFLTQALAGLRERLARFNGTHIPTYGRATGLMVNYTPDHAVQYDLDGVPLRNFDRAYRVGSVNLSIGGRALSREEAVAILGGP